MNPNDIVDSKCLADRTAHKGQQHEISFPKETEGIEQAFDKVLSDPNFSGWGHEVLEKKKW